jgi:pimeloyl-ACP methyl ester carboxylesterase
MLAALPAAGSAASAQWQTCTGALYQLECAGFTMPLDRTGELTGTTTVRAIRQPAAEGPRIGTLFVIGGGPGQNSTMLIGMMNDLFAGANRYDIVAVDQRGAGASEPLDCPRIESGAFTWNGADPATDRPITDCSIALGPARAAYNTAEAVADLEAIRADLGVETATFLGISYGTKVALAYAKAHPSHTRALLLDSVLPTDMPDAFDVDSVTALRGALRGICGGGRCRAIGGDPVARTERLANRLERSPLPVRLVRPDERRIESAIDPIALSEIIRQADINPFIYNQLPSVLASALAGDDAGLIRLYAIVNGMMPEQPAPPTQRRSASARTLTPGGRLKGRDAEALAQFSTTMFFATTCADFAPPWPRSEDVSGRQSAIDAAAATIDERAFRPFTRATIAADSTAAYCRGWQQAPALPAIAQGPLPDIPTLALNGQLDLRTPTAPARAAIAGSPRAQLVELPNVGHSTLGMDLSGCSLSLARRFLIFGATDGKCRNNPAPLPIAPRPPRSLAAVRPARGTCRRISRRNCRRVLQILTAGYLGMRDALDQVLIGGVDTGPGLYSGDFEVEYEIDDNLLLVPTDISLAGVSNVPGIDVSGKLTFDRLPRLSGTLRAGGYRIDVSGNIRYDRSADRLTLLATRGRTSARIRLLPRSSRARGAAPRSRQLALRRSFALAVGQPRR